MSISAMKRLLIIWLLGLGLLAFVGINPIYVSAAPLRQAACTLPATVTTAAQLSDCITAANANGAGLDTITLGADITLTTALPQITSAITLEGANHVINGGNSVQLFYVNYGNFTVNQVTLQNGSATDGGGIHNYYGTLTVTNSTFSGNSAAKGGGIFTRGGLLTVNNSIFSDNTASGDGGGIYNFYGRLTVNNSTFSGNRATGSGGGLANSTVSNNTTVTNSTFSGNSAASYGGGIYNLGLLTITNSTVSGNTATDGGGIQSNDTLKITNSTFSGNTATRNGGGIYNLNTLHLAGTIFANSTSGNNCNSANAINDNGYNLSDDASCGFNGTSADNATLNLGDLANNGGPTQTHLPGAGSGAIGTIPNGTIISNNGASWTCNQTSTDQRGISRPINSGNDCTAGAVEVAPPCPSWTATTADELFYCITHANSNGARLDTISLGANISLATLTTSPLPNVTSTIVVEGAGHAIDGGDSVRIFYVGSTGNLTVNQATLQNGFADNGGGVYNNGGTLTVTNSTLSGNSATNNGGGIHNAFDSTLTVADSLFSGNTQTYQGGGIYNNGRATVTKSTFVSNAVTFSGGGITSLGVLTVTASTFSANTASNSGGGIDNNGAATVTASTFSGNRATVFGGGIRNSAGRTLIATHNTFSGNSAANSGGGIYNFGGTLHLAGNLFAVGAQGANCGANGGTLNDNGYNLSDDGTCTNSGTGSAANATLNLKPLTDNGGSTQTHLPDYPSDAIGAIPNGATLSNSGVTLACNSTTTDQTGNNRPINTGTACSSGAVEVIPNYANLTIIKDATPGIGTDFDFTIKSAPLTSYSGSTTGGPFWTRPNEGTSCTLSTNSVRYHVQAFAVATSGNYGIGSQQNYNGYIHLYQDSFDPSDPCANYLNGNDNGGLAGNSRSELTHSLEAGRIYYLVTSGFASADVGNFTNGISGVGTVYRLYSSFTLDDAVPDDGDVVDASITFNVAPGAFTVSEAAATGWGLTGAACTGASGSVSLVDETLSVVVGANESVQCTFTNETVCPASGTVTTAAELAGCIIEANANESPNPTADTITLGANITLTTALPQITSAITLEGADYFIDGGNSVQLFYVDVDGDFTVNQATLQNGSAKDGGGIRNDGTLTVTDSTISGNRASISGGGIYSNGPLTVTNSVFSGNTAVDYYGGGIYNTETVIVTNSTFAGNSAFANGGGIYTGSTATMTVTNSTFSGNSATHSGGIYNDGTLTVANSTFSGNTVDFDGGGIYNDGLLIATNSTFSGNTSRYGSGGGVYNHSSGTAYLAGTIFASGTNGDNCFGTLTDNGYNLSDDTSCGFSGTSEDSATLNLGALADNGGPTQTHLPGAGSAAIGAIPNGTTISNNGASWTCDQSATDQRGESRPINSGDACTAGAVEVTPICTSWTVTTADELSDCITLANGNGSPSSTADTITLGANITLTTALPQITSAITLEGANQVIDGGNSVRIFDVSASGNFTINQTTLQNGSATNGGAIYNNGTLTITNSTLSGNTASVSGAIHNYYGTLTITNSTLSGNTASSGEGGAIANKGGTIIATNSTFSDHTAGHTGGVIDNGGNGNVTITNSTFSGNSSISSGSSIYNFSGTLHLAGNIFAGGSGSDNCVNNSTLNDNGYNLSDDSTCTNSGTGSATNATLKLGVLADNGGPTLTHLPGTDSDAIGAIPNGTTISNNDTSWSCDQSATDQRGELRPITLATACTAGAVEVELPPLCPSWTATTADELADCITLANANESPSPTADTITLGANINLTSALPQITSEITLEGAGYAVDGGNSVQIFKVSAAGNLTINALMIKNGKTSNNGGGLNNNGTVTVSNSTFSGNSASYGGGIANTGTVTVSNSTFSGNSGIFGGGISDYGTMTVSNSTFSGNSADYGGGIGHGGQGNHLTVTNSTFFGNSASNAGGAIYNISKLILTSNTFFGNSATNGSTLYNFSTMRLAGNLFAAGSGGTNCANKLTLIDNGYNLSADSTCTISGAGSATNATLNLNDLADNGGPTLTHLPGAGSDAIGAIPYGTTISNAGISWTCDQSATDQRGESRPINSGDACTAGAVEVTPICTSWTVTTAAELSDCITLANANEGPSPTADTITLGANITLTTALPQITSEIMLEGAGFAVDGGKSVQIFNVASTGDFTINQATLQNGNAANGGAIENDGTLVVSTSTISGSVGSLGAGILNAGILQMSNSTLANNSASSAGGGHL